MRKSTQKRLKTTRKQPRGTYRIFYDPVDLPDDFPIKMIRRERKSDRPITKLSRHDCLEIGLCHSGSGIVVIEDKVFSFGAGDVLITNDRELHRCRSSKGCYSEWTWIPFDPQRLLGLSTPSSSMLDIAPFCGSEFPNVLPANQYEDVVTIVRELISELTGEKPGYRSAVRGLAWTLMVRLHRLPGKRGSDPAPSTRTHIERIAPALEYLATHFTEPVHVEDLAHVCHLSVTHFRRLFAEAVRKSPMRYVAQLRIQMATALLENANRTVLAISHEAGFETLSSFNRQFRSQTGMSPREWRRR